MVRDIGTRARAEIGKLLGCRCTSSSSCASIRAGARRRRACARWLRATAGAAGPKKGRR